jgi:hypothetical protein
VDTALLLVYLFLAYAGDYPRDCLTLLNADEYFQARQIATKPATMQELAATEPVDARTQVRQLLAVRWLGEHKVEKARGTLEKIAQGQVAQDRPGFARDDAKRALAQLDGQAIEPPISFKDRLHEALAWFPEDVACFGVLDLDGRWGKQPFNPEIFRFYRESNAFAEQKEQLYGFVEDWGNIRLQRISFGCSPAAPPEHGPRLFLRLTGLADHNRLKEYLQKEKRVTVVREEKGLNGEPVALLSSENGPVFVLVGDTDLILAIGEDPGKSLKAAEQVLEVRAGKQANLLHGPWAAVLNEIPDDACGLLIGEPPESMPEEGGAVDGPLPRRMVGHLIVHESIDIHFAAVMRNAADVQAFTENLVSLRDRNIASLKGLSQRPATGVLIRAWESIKVENNGLEVRGAAHLSGDVPGAIVEDAEEEIKAIKAVLGVFKEGIEALCSPDLVKSIFAGIDQIVAVFMALLGLLVFMLTLAAALFIQGKITRTTK